MKYVLRFPLMICVFAAILAGCQEQVRCGPGTHEQDGICVVDDADGDQDIPTDHPGEEQPGQDAWDGPDGQAEDIAPDSPDAIPDDVTIRCNSSVDCLGGRICREGRCIPAPAVCTSELDCPVGPGGIQLACDTGRCVVRCESACDCEPYTEICVEWRCVEPPAPCGDAADCPCGMECDAGECAAWCSGSCDCLGRVCRGGQCVPSDGTCAFDDDCPCGSYSRSMGCFDGGCGRPCSDPCDCLFGEACIDGRCSSPPFMCEGDDDCPCYDGVRTACVAGGCYTPCGDDCDCRDRPLCIEGLCQVAPEECVTDEDCGCIEGMQPRCREGRCVMICESSCDCPGEMICEDGTCTYPPYACSDAEDCHCGKPCIEGRCGCTRTPYDCLVGKTCAIDGTCVDPPAVCADHSECPTTDGGPGMTFCSGGSCVSCPAYYDACFGQDAYCGTCSDGTQMVCNSAPGYEMNSYCGLPCTTSCECASEDYVSYLCIAGRCALSYEQYPFPCVRNEDCPCLGRFLGERWDLFQFVCAEDGTCQPPYCVTSCDCENTDIRGNYSPHVCRDEACRPASAECSSMDDCPCLFGNIYECNYPGNCEPLQS